ncbi:MAG: hypothetical protein P8Y64_10725 [Gammaproteobacteria bacterium]
MKTTLSKVLAVTALLMFMGAAHAADKLKPYVLGSQGPGDLTTKVNQVKSALTSNGFRIVGSFSPFKDAEVIVVTNNTLLADAAKSERGGYAAVMRVAVTKVGDQIQVAYQNPVYFQYALHVKGDLKPVAAALGKALGDQETFGAKGETPDDLEDYHYTFGMEYFEDVYRLASYSSHAKAVAAVEKGMAAHAGGAYKVFKLDIPGTNDTLFGVMLKQGPKGDKYADLGFQMGVVNFNKLKGNAYLPYPVLVRGGKVESLHMRFWMAVNFPDLKMIGSNSFMTLMPSPDAMKNALTKMAGGTVENNATF